MDGDFELNKSGWYKPINVLGNDFINSKNSPEDQAKYGKTYSVRFEGDDETYIWTAKTMPEEGRKYYGHIQETSGRSLRFKTDKEPEDTTRPAGAIERRDYKSSGKDITLGMVWKTVAGIRGLPENDEEFAKFFEIVDAHLNELMMMSEKLNDTKDSTSA